MNSLAAVGLAKSAAQLGSLCSASAEILLKIHTHQKRSAKTLASMETECRTVGTAAQYMKTWAEGDVGRSAERGEQCIALDSALKCLIPSVQVVHTDLDKFLTKYEDDEGELDVVGRSKILWREDEMKTFLEEIRWQAEHIHLLVATMTLSATQGTKTVGEWRSEASVHYSMGEDDQSALGQTTFDFDHEISNTPVYRRALLSEKTKATPPPATVQALAEHSSLQAVQEEADEEEEEKPV